MGLSPILRIAVSRVISVVRRDSAANVAVAVAHYGVVSTPSRLEAVRVYSRNFDAIDIPEEETAANVLD